MLEYTVDKIISSDIKICQPKKGFRFGTDSLILAYFANIKKYDKILDIGSGSGILPILLLKKVPELSITAVEIQDNMYSCLIKTVELNNYQDKITTINSDIKNYSANYQYDVIISNPPYRPNNIGKKKKDDSENIARFEDSLTIRDLISTARKLIKYKGKLYLCGDCDRLSEVMFHLSANDFQTKRLQFLYPDNNKSARIFFLESVFQGGVQLIVETPLFQNSTLFENILSMKGFLKGDL